MLKIPFFCCLTFLSTLAMQSNFDSVELKASNNCKRQRFLAKEASPALFSKLPNEISLIILKDLIFSYKRKFQFTLAITQDLLNIAQVNKKTNQWINQDERIKFLITTFAQAWFYGNEPDAYKTIRLKGKNNETIRNWYFEKEKLRMKEHELRHYAFCSNAKKIKELLQAGVNINAQNCAGQTALMRLAFPLGKYYWADDEMDSLRLLLNSKADPNIKDCEGKNAVIVFASGGKAPKAAYELLKEAGANMHAIDNEGRSALFYAAEKFESDVFEYLLNLGLDCNLQDTLGRTPLMSAVENLNTDYIRLLLQKGARIMTRDAFGTCVLDTQKVKDHIATFQLFVEHLENYPE